MYNDDPPKLWAFEALKHLPFLQDLEQDKEWIILHNIYHAMSRRLIPAGGYLFKYGEEINHLRLIQDGVVELYVRTFLILTNLQIEIDG